jgi:poly(3-hydroxybutyrate) depolymerase
MTLMGGPIDTRRSPTKVNALAQSRGVDWFRENCLQSVPFPYPGVGRSVYPGFLQLSGFMAMNFDRHVTAHVDMFNHLVKGDGDSAEKHRDFYDEYLAVMDLTAEFYIQTVDTVFVRHALPKGEMRQRGERVDPGSIRNVALMTVEGENDDISGVGQTKAAHDLCVNLPDSMKMAYVQASVGHYGVFNGSRFRAEIAPRMTAFQIQAGRPKAIAPAKRAKKR